jgi:hypothetical protein
MLCKSIWDLLDYQAAQICALVHFGDYERAEVRLLWAYLHREVVTADVVRDWRRQALVGCKRSLSETYFLDGSVMQGLEGAL